MTAQQSLALPLELAGPLPADLVAGLERSPPRWPVDRATWAGVVADVAAFAERWDSQARAAGYSDLELYGLHRSAPYTNLSAMGAAWVMARGGFAAIAVTADAIAMRSRTGATLRIRRFAISPDAVLPWSFRPGASAPNFPVNKKRP